MSCFNYGTWKSGRVVLQKNGSKDLLFFIFLFFFYFIKYLKLDLDIIFVQF
jgi:hypothetical protein